MEKVDRETILIIDDEEGARQTIRRMLEYYNFNVLESESGHAGLNLYREDQCNIDLILLDLIMPEMSGEETLAKSLSFDPQAKIAICTGRAIMGMPRKDEFRRAVSFIKKPVTAENLLTKVSKALEQ